MLNISDNSVAQYIDASRYRTFEIFKESKAKRRRYIFSSIFILMVICLFLPWTQNISGKGFLTSLRPEERPQNIPSLISGRIEKWYVQEGDYVEQGDTIVRISEIKDDYFDPQLLERTQDQILAKESSVKSYMEKVKALDAQIDALNQNLQLKLQQARNKVKQARLKVTADSIDLQAARTNYSIAERQFERLEELFEQGLKSRTELETRQQKLQEAQAKLVSQESKLLSSRNEVINAEVELNSIRADYRNKLNKAESEKFSTLSNMYDAEANVTKLQNQYSNYSVRQGFYIIRAPQNGYVTKATRSGIGETLKEGETVVTVMPAEYQLAVEMYLRPIDLPLVDKGQEILIQFDGWPAIVFSGWPGISTGTYTGEVVAIDNFTSANGKYRLLVSPDPNEPEWPKELRVGAGARTFALLKDVPIWYEIWRQINGFPPDYYTGKDGDEEPVSDKVKDEK